MYELKVTGKQEFMGKEIPVVLGGFGPDEKCICDKTIAELHNLQLWHVRRDISNNIKRFQENIDYVDLGQRHGETETLELLKSMGYSKQSIVQAEHIYLLSERGYLKLIKIMDNDLAWDTYNEVIDGYFHYREEKKKKAPNAMETLRLHYAALEELDERTTAIEEKMETVIDRVDNQMTIDHGQQRTLQEAVGKRVYERAAMIYRPDEIKKNTRNLFPALYRDLKNRFGVPSYRDIKPKDYPAAMKYIEAWVEPADLREESL